MAVASGVNPIVRGSAVAHITHINIPMADLRIKALHQFNKRFQILYIKLLLILPQEAVTIK